MHSQPCVAVKTVIQEKQFRNKKHMSIQNSSGKITGLVQKNFSRKQSVYGIFRVYGITGIFLI